MSSAVVVALFVLATGRPEPVMEEISFDDEGRATVVLVNRGSGALNGEGGVALYVGGELAEYVSFEGWAGPPDPAGLSPHVVSFSHRMLGFDHQILLRVDPYNRLDEHSELNNWTSFRRSFYRLAPDVGFDSVDPSADELYARLRNFGNESAKAGEATLWFFRNGKSAGKQAFAIPDLPPGKAFDLPMGKVPDESESDPARWELVLELPEWLDGNMGNNRWEIVYPFPWRKSYEQLLEDDRIRKALVWLTPTGERLEYPSWPTWLQDMLDQAYRDVAESRDPAGPRPAFFSPDGYYGTYTKFHEGEAARTYTAHVAQSLWAEVMSAVPWTLFALSEEQRGHLLRADSLFMLAAHADGTAGPYYHTDATNSALAQLSSGGISPWSAFMSYRFLRNAGLIGATHAETVARLLDWTRVTIYHVNSGHDRTYLWGLPHLTTEGALFTPYGSLNITSGCSGNVGLLKALLRTVNIPVLHHTIGLHPDEGDFAMGIIASGSHSRIEFPTFSAHLAHGDDIMGLSPVVTSLSPLYGSERVLYSEADWVSLSSQPSDCASFSCTPGVVDPRCEEAEFCNPPEWQFYKERERHELFDRLIARDLSLGLLAVLDPNFHLTVAANHDAYLAQPVLTLSEREMIRATVEGWILEEGGGDWNAGRDALIEAVNSSNPVYNTYLHR